MKSAVTILSLVFMSLTVTAAEPTKLGCVSLLEPRSSIIDWDPHTVFSYESTILALEAEALRVSQFLNGSKIFKPLRRLNVYGRGLNALYSGADLFRGRIQVGVIAPEPVVKAAFRHEIGHFIFHDTLLERRPQYKTIFDELTITDDMSQLSKNWQKRSGQMALLLRLTEVFAEMLEAYFDGDGDTLYEYVNWFYSNEIPAPEVYETRRFNVSEDFKTLMEKWQNVHEPQVISMHCSFLPGSVYTFREFRSWAGPQPYSNEKVQLVLEAVYLALEKTFDDLVGRPGFQSEVGFASDWPFRIGGGQAVRPNDANQIFVDNFRQFWRPQK